MSIKNATKRKIPAKKVFKRTKKSHSIEDEISSDSDEDLQQQKDSFASEDSDFEETAQEKKLRLTKQYLQELKEIKAQDEENDDETDAVGEKLKEDLLEQAGKLQKQIAHKCIQPKTDDFKVLRGHKLSVTCIAVSHDGKLLFTASKDCCIIKYDLLQFKKVGKILGGHRCDANVTHTGQILCLALSTDGELLVSGGTDEMIHVWRASTCEHIHRFQGHRGPITGLVFRMNSKQLFSSSFDRCVKVWDLEAMGYVETLFGHQDQVQACDSLTRQRCATAGGRDGSIRVWKIVEESQFVYHGHTGSIDCLKLINEEYFITGSDDGSVCLWSIMKKKPINSIKDAHPNPESTSSPWITAVTALINSDLIATGSSSGSVRIWKCGHKFLSMECLFEIPVIGFVNSLQFSLTGDKLFIGVGQEHRLGRWWRIKEARNSIVIVSLFENAE